MSKHLAIQQKFLEEKLQGANAKISNLERGNAVLRDELAATVDWAVKAEDEAKTLRSWEKEENKLVASEIQVVVNAYEQVLMGVGKETEVQEGVSVHDSLKWLEKHVFVYS